MLRERPLDPPHKGLRLQLGLLALESGRVDCDSPSDVARLRSTAAFTFHLLSEHAMNEDDFLFSALEARMPGATASVEAQHPRLEGQANALAERFAGLEAPVDEPVVHALYLDVTAFQAEYLQHLLAEEREIEPLLLEHFTDEELADIQVAIAEVSEPGILLDWFQACVPARSDAANREVLSRMKGALPPDAFGAIADRVSSVVTPQRRTALFEGL